MQAFGLSEVELQARGAEWTAREICQQPDVWERVAASLAADGSGVARFVADLLARTDVRIVLTGAGTSAFIGQCLAPALSARWQRWVSAVSTTDLVASPGKWLLPDFPTLLVSFARSGGSPESVAAFDLTERLVPDCHHLVITCNDEGALAQRARGTTRARVLVMDEATNDRGFAMTSSFSSMLLAAAQTFDLLQREDASAAAARARDILRKSANLAGELAQAGFERAVFLGSGELAALAREAALKMLELTDGKVVAVAETPLGFRHGPKTIVNRKTVVLVFLSNDPYTRRYDLDLLKELRSDGIAGRVLALSAQAGPDAGSRAGTRASSGDRASESRGNEILVADAAHASDLELCFPFVLFAQCFAVRQSLALGLRPDTPNAAGIVSRIVRGVSIYPWESGR